MSTQKKIQEKIDILEQEISLHEIVLFNDEVNTFEYVINHYPIEESFFESQFWKAKVLIEMQAFDEAEELLLSLIDLFDEQQTLEENEDEGWENIQLTTQVTNIS